VGGGWSYSSLPWGLPGGGRLKPYCGMPGSGSRPSPVKLGNRTSPCLDASHGGEPRGRQSPFGLSTVHQHLQPHVLEPTTPTLRSGSLLQGQVGGGEIRATERCGRAVTGRALG
jgi:hypothetical protein